MKRHPIRHYFIPVTFILLLAGLAGAQNQELDKLRTIYFKQVKNVSIPVDKKYGQALVNLQKELIAENNLEEALIVKKEIERLKAKINAAPAKTSATTSLKPKPKTTESTPAKKNRTKPEELIWRGDFHKRTIDGEDVFLIEADADVDVSIIAEIFDVVAKYPNGAVWRFLYKTDNYEGLGFQIIFNYPDIRVLQRTASAIRPNGNWIERTLPKEDFKGEDHIEYEIKLLKGSGDVYIKDIELRPN